MWQLRRGQLGAARIQRQLLSSRETGKVGSSTIRLSCGLSGTAFTRLGLLASFVAWSMRFREYNRLFLFWEIADCTLCLFPVDQPTRLSSGVPMYCGSCWKPSGLESNDQAMVQRPVIEAPSDCFYASPLARAGIRFCALLSPPRSDHNVEANFALLHRNHPHARGDGFSFLRHVGFGAVFYL